MEHQERPLHQATNDFERASKAMTAEHELVAGATEESATEKKSENLNQAIERYQSIQKQIIELEGNLKRSMDDAVEARKDNAARADLLTAIGKAITEDIARYQVLKTESEQAIRDAGADPVAYILQ